MHVDKVLSDEPIYEAISNLDVFYVKEGGRPISYGQALFVSFASSFCGLVTWYTLDSGNHNFGIHWWENLAISMGVTLFLGTVAMVSHHARCTVSLMLPVLFSELGRSLIRALIISLIVSGPLQNIIDNGLLLAKSMECSARLTVEQANETAQASIDIMNQQIESIVEATRKINEHSKKVEAFADREMLKVLDEEDGRGHLSPDEMMKRGSKQCHRNSDGPRMKCEYGINSDLEKCNKIRVDDDGCQEYSSANSQDQNLQHTKDVRDSVAKFGEQYKEPELELTAGNRIEVNSSKVSQGFKKTMKQITTLGYYVSSFINWLSVLLLCLVLVKSIRHQVKFLTRLSYTNNVVTTQLLKLDASLPSYHRTFPLPIYMRRFVRDGKQKCVSGEELGSFVIATLKHVLFSFLFVLVVFIDVQIYRIIEDISDTGYIVYEVYIKIGVVMESDGGKWTKGIMDGIPQLNDIHHLSFTQDNNNCLPDATPPDRERTICIFVFILLIVLLNFFQIYSRRTVRRILAWFYPEREERRVQFLYRFLKQRRIDCFSMLVEDKRGCLPQRSTLNKMFPSIFKPTCVVCGSTKKHFACFYCFGHGYDIMYCWDCWSDAENKCQYCRTTQKLASTSKKKLIQSSSSESDSDTYVGPGRIYQINSDDTDGEEVIIGRVHTVSSKFSKMAESLADSSTDEDTVPQNNLK